MFWKIHVWKHIFYHCFLHAVFFLCVLNRQVPGVALMNSIESTLKSYQLLHNKFFPSLVHSSQETNNFLSREDSSNSYGRAEFLLQWIQVKKKKENKDRHFFFPPFSYSFCFIGEILAKNGKECWKVVGLTHFSKSDWLLIRIFWEGFLCWAKNFSASPYKNQNLFCKFKHGKWSILKSYFEIVCQSWK